MLTGSLPPREVDGDWVGGRGAAYWGILLLVAVAVLAAWNRPAPPVGRARPGGFLCFRPQDQFRGLAIAGNRLWAGGRDALLLVDWREGREQPLPLGTPALSQINEVAADSSGKAWVAHSAGLHVEDGHGWQDLTTVLPAVPVWTVFPARTGEVWVGTASGTGCFRNGVWKPFEHPEGLAHAMVRKVLVDGRGGLWIGSYAAPDGGLSWFGEGAGRIFRVGDGLPHNNVVALAEDGSGTVWVGTGFFDRGGLTSFTATGPGRFRIRQFSRADGLAGEKCRSVYEDRQGVLWAGSEYDGLARFNGRTWRRFGEADGLSGTEVMSLVQDPDGNLWLGTNRGLMRLASSSLPLWQVDPPAGAQPAGAQPASAQPAVSPAGAP